MKREIITRNGVSITGTMLSVLHQLNAVAHSDVRYLPLPDVHGHTIRALLKRDWIFRSYFPELDDAPTYCITSRGQKALQQFNTPIDRHYDGLCPSCRQHPRYRWKNGQLDAYCHDCKLAYERSYYKLKMNGVMSSCKKHNN